MIQNCPKMTQNFPKLPLNGSKMTPGVTHFFSNFFWLKSGSANFFAFRMYGDMFALAYTSRKSQNFGNKVNLWFEQEESFLIIILLLPNPPSAPDPLSPQVWSFLREKNWPVIFFWKWAIAKSLYLVLLYQLYQPKIMFWGSYNDSPFSLKKYFPR